MQLLGGKWLQLREVEVIGQNGVNKALKKNATHSSLYQERTPASKAVDGEKGIAFEYSTSITSWEQGKYHSPYIIFILISFKNADLNFSCLFV